MANKMITVCAYFLMATALVLSAQSCRSTTPTGATDRTQGTTPKVEPPKGEAASYKVEINVRGGKCVFNYDGQHKGEVETEILAPCEFVRDRAGKIRYYDYKTKGIGSYSVILVIGGPPAPGGHPDQYMKSCGSQVRAISLSPRGVALGPIGSVFAICPTYNVDEIMFKADSIPV